jgi:hypothetical protein
MTKSKKAIQVADAIPQQEISPVGPLHVCYIGESLVKYGLTTGTTFKDVLPAHVTQLINKYSFIRHLLIDVEELQPAKARLKVAGSLENQSNLRLREIQ